MLLVYSPDPEYTKAARTDKVKGTVLLDGTLGKDSCVRGIRIVRRLGYGLDENAVYAVQRWKFEARPTEIRLLIEVNFDPNWSPDRASLPENMCGEQFEHPTAQSQAQSPIASNEKTRLDLPSRSQRPKLLLQDALKIAKKFIASENIDATHFWLYRANFIFYGDSAKPPEDKIPGWHFWWVSDSGQVGNYIEIFVSMDGHCRRLPSM